MNTEKPSFRLPDNITQEIVVGLLESGDTISRDDLNLLAQKISNWPKDDCFSGKTVERVSSLAHPFLLGEVVKRCQKLPPVSTMLYLVNNCPNDIASFQEKEECFETLIPLLSEQDRSYALGLFCKNGMLSSVKKLLPDPKKISNEEILDLLDATVLYDTNQTDTIHPDRAQIIDHLTMDLKDLMDDGSVLYAASQANLPYLEKIAPYFKQGLLPDLLVKLLMDPELPGRDPVAVARHNKVVKFLYQESVTTFLSYTDDQLNLFLKKDSHPLFWDIHNQYRLKQQLSESIEEDVEKKPRSLAKKM